jgi:hypothetical protein
LCTLLTGAVPDKAHHLLVIADVPGDTWMDQGLAGADPDPWAALIAGHELGLPTIDGYRNRVDAARGITVDLAGPPTAA